MTKLALITGASSGIGAALARHLAVAGYDLALVARRLERLEALATELREAHGREVQCVGLDVTGDDALETLLSAVPRLDLLVNNAGLGVFGLGAEQDPAQLGRLVRLNCEALTRLSLGYLPGLVAQGSGAIVNVGSVAGFQPLPYYAAYGASKAYVHSFSQALDEEVRERGVRVMVVAPGPVPTEFQGKAGTPDANHSSKLELRTPDQIAEAVLAALKRPRRMIVPAPFHRLTRLLVRWLPTSWVLRIASKKMKKRV